MIMAITHFILSKTDYRPHTAKHMRNVFFACIALALCVDIAIVKIAWAIAL